MLKKLLFDLLSCPSVTPAEAGCFAICERALPGFVATRIDAPASAPEHLRASNLLLRRECNPAGRVHFVFGCHADVVPAGAGWQSEPFVPQEAAGRIYARGAADMKAGLAAAICAAAAFEPAANCEIASLSLLITSDEEGEGTYGTAYALERLAAAGLRFSDALVTEPTCGARFGDTIKTARRGSIHLRVKFTGRGGHIAYAAQCANPVELAAPAIARIAGAELDAGCGIFAPSKLVVSNLHAGGGALNVSPHELELLANVRNSPATDEASVRAFIEQAIAALPAVADGRLSAEISLRTASKPFSCDEASALVSSLAAAVQAECGQRPVCNAEGGTSDARHFAAAGARACEFGPRNEGIHAPNESVAWEEVAACARIYLQTINNLKEKQ